MISDLKKICLGSANFGGYYGYKKSKVKKKEIAKIFKYVKSKKITYIDTAFNYLNSQKIIGENSSNLKIITKIPKTPNSVSDPQNWIKKIISKSLNDLKAKKLYAVLFHYPPYQIDKKKFVQIIEYLEALRKKKVITKIGVSGYSVNEIKKSFSIYKFQIIQVQANILDQKILKDSFIKTLKKKGVEIHIRSIFLQGMLLSNVSHIPKKFKHLQKTLIYFDNWVKKRNISKLSACLHYILSFSMIDKIVLGTSNYSQLKQTVRTIEKIRGKLSIPKKFSNLNQNQLNPKNWQ